MRASDLSWRVREIAATSTEGVEGWLLGERRALYAAAVCRIGTALSVLGLLVANFSSRDLWVGQASVWAEPARAISQFPELALLHNVSGDMLTLIYVVTMAAALAMTLGWHTKAANVVTLVGFIAIVGQNPVVGDQSDNLVRLTLLWLLLMRTSERWSLDARRRERHAGLDVNAARQAWNGDDVLPVWLSTGLHHVGLVGLAVQTILLYMAGGLDKISQGVWQHGTALYYTMQLPDYRPFPWLSDALTSSQVIIALVTYAVLFAQLFFGPLLLNPISRRVVLAVTIGVNVLFAIALALPWTSLALIGVTCVFVSEATFEWIDERARRLLAPVGDWLAVRGYDLIDAGDAIAHRTVYPVIDWVRFTVLRR